LHRVFYYMKVRFYTQEDYHNSEGVIDFTRGQDGTFLQWGTQTNGVGEDTIAVVKDSLGHVHLIHPEWLSFVGSQNDLIESLLEEIVDEYIPSALHVDARAQIKAILKRHL